MAESLLAFSQETFTRDRGRPSGLEIHSRNPAVVLRREAPFNSPLQVSEADRHDHCREVETVGVSRLREAALMNIGAADVIARSYCPANVHGTPGSSRLQLVAHWDCCTPPVARSGGCPGMFMIARRAASGLLLTSY